MGYHLETFATWLRKERSLSNDIEILIDRAAIPRDRKQRPATRWDHLAKQKSFDMPKVPSRRRLGDTIEVDTATKSSPLATHMIKQTSFYLSRGGTGSRLGRDGEEGAARPGIVKQASLSTLPRQRSFKNLTEDEQMKMPRLVKQSSFKSLPRGVCDDDQSIGGNRPCMNKKHFVSLPSRPSLPHQRRVSSCGKEPNDGIELLARTDVTGSDSDEKTTNFSNVPRFGKQTSFTDARLSSCWPIVGDVEMGGNCTDRRRQWRMAKQNSFTMPRRPTRTFDSEDERIDASTSMPRLEEQTSFAVAKLQEQECCSKKSKVLFLFSVLTQALEVTEEVMDDVCKERAALARRSI